MSKENLKFLYTEIGRGHPFYLDGIIEELHRIDNQKLVYSTSSVFDHATGISHLAWLFVLTLYKQGGRDGIVSAFYKKLRKNTDYNKPSFAIKVLGRNIQKKILYDMTSLVVAHPILIAILKGRKNVYYQHGELVTPNEAVVKGADKVFVPTESAGKPFLEKYSTKDIIITGLCIEPSLVHIASDAFESRLKRYETHSILTGCFISSGAEPIAHLRIIINSVQSHLQSGGKAILFVKSDGHLQVMSEKLLLSGKYESLRINSLDQIPDTLPKLTIVQFSNRKEENKFTSHLFHNFDFIVSPSHERSNWAIGLGLPMFITEPSIGPFAPLNREYLLTSKTADLIKNVADAKMFAIRLKKMHNEKQLLQMAKNGWGKQPIDGFKKLVTYFQNKL